MPVAGYRMPDAGKKGIGHEARGKEGEAGGAIRKAPRIFGRG